MVREWEGILHFFPVFLGRNLYEEGKISMYHVIPVPFFLSVFWPKLRSHFVLIAFIIMNFRKPNYWERVLLFIFFKGHTQLKSVLNSKAFLVQICNTCVYIPIFMSCTLHCNSYFCDYLAWWAVPFLWAGIVSIHLLNHSSFVRQVVSV